MGARDSPFVSLFVSLNEIWRIGRFDNLVSTLCLTQSDPPPPPNPGYAFAIPGSLTWVLTMGVVVVGGGGD